MFNFYVNMGRAGRSTESMVPNTVEDLVPNSSQLNSKVIPRLKNQSWTWRDRIIENLYDIVAVEKLGEEFVIKIGDTVTAIDDNDHTRGKVKSVHVLYSTTLADVLWDGSKVSERINAKNLKKVIDIPKF